MGIFYNTLLEDAILPLGDKALGTSYMGSLREWRGIQAKSSDELHSMQSSSLSKLLSFASSHSDYYKRQAIPVNTDPYQWIKGFPIVTKATIRENLDGMVTKDRSQMVKISSSGSSGVQGAVYMEKTNQSNQLAVQTLWWEWAGYHIGDRILQTGITPARGKVKAVKDLLLNTLYVPAYKLDQKDILGILKGLQKSPRKFFMGYASSLFVFAKVAEENGIDNVRFQSVVSWGDKMFPHFRELIQKRFHTEVFDTYGCSEGFMIAAECREHRYHIMTPLVYLELVNDNGEAVPPGELGHVVVTRLDTYGMPLIRYRLGDLAIVEEENVQCTCGLHFPILKKIIGRDTDIIKTKSGKYMVVHAFTGIFEHLAEIKQFRVVQKDIDGIEIEYIPGIGFENQVLQGIRSKINEYLNEDFWVDFKEVSSIPNTPSGKPQIIQSFLKQSVLQ